MGQPGVRGPPGHPGDTGSPGINFDIRTEC